MLPQRTPTVVPDRDEPLPVRRPTVAGLPVRPVASPATEQVVPPAAAPAASAPPVAPPAAPTPAPAPAAHAPEPVAAPASTTAGSSPNDVRDPAAMLSIGRPLLEGRTLAGLPLRTPGNAKPNVGADERSVGVSQPDQVRANLAAFARGVNAAGSGAATSLADRVAAERAALAARPAPALPSRPTHPTPATPANTATSTDHSDQVDAAERTY